MLLGLGTEAQLVDMVDDLAQVVAALNLVLDLAENLADLVFDGVGTGGLELEAVQIGEQLLVDEIAQVVPGQGTVVIKLAGGCLRCRPAFPAVGFFEDIAIVTPLQQRFRRLVPLQGIKVFQEQQPRTLLGIIQLTGAAGILPQHIIDIFKGLLEHEADAPRYWNGSID
jgi:hypothetical protein